MRGRRCLALASGRTRGATHSDRSRRGELAFEEEKDRARFGEDRILSSTSSMAES